MEKKPTDAERRKFLKQSSWVGMGIYLATSPVFAHNHKPGVSQATEPLLDWTDWEKYRTKVKHPCLVIKPENMDIAQENLRRYGWARDYAERIEKMIQRHFQLITPEFLENMIEETTPGDPLWTPCPACRDQGKPVHPHGLWTWEVDKPDQLKCNECQTVFPHSRYPEDIILQTKWGKPQTITYCGGEPFVIFGYRKGRPSFTANIRSRKVQWMASYCRTLAEGYLLSGKKSYAKACRDILLRFAACYPNWLVHVGYGEYADMDPRIASLNINKLPSPEICPPPNEPDKSLWTGFWSAGRASGVGLESDFVRKVVTAYDLTSQAAFGADPVYTADQKRKIERDLLLESTILLVCDKKLNNKSVSNRTATALVGLCVGHPGLVRFGLEGFLQTVDRWFLPDGTTSESPFYGLMTLGGIWDMAQAAQGYSDPEGYRDPSGQRIDSLDLYHGSNYHRVWDAFFRGLQGDLRYPPYADSFRGTYLDTAYVELMVANYPERVEYLSLLKELCGKDLFLHSGSLPPDHDLPGQDKEVDVEPVLTLPYDLTKPTGSSSFSFYYRQPGLENKDAPDLTLSDWCPPALRIGHLRSGADGRESLLLLSASHWGVHHENDSLSLYYWKKGCEILSDLGYLWDHPLKPQNIRTVAHNTVVIDGKNQVSKQRGGEVLHFKTFDQVKVMEMSSEAYPECRLYRRTSAIIDHGKGKNYVVDFFRVEGGKQQDFVFHGVSPYFEIEGVELEPFPTGALYDFKNIRTAKGEGVWRAKWKSGDAMTSVAWSVGQKGEQAFVAEGWGQRDWKNSDMDATIPYIVRRCKGGGVKTFISVFEGYEGATPFVRQVSLIDPKGILLIETEMGNDYVMSIPDTGILKINSRSGEEKIQGHFAAGSVQNNTLVWQANVLPKQ